MADRRLSSLTDGLAASVFSKDIDRAYNLARQVDAGLCHINSPSVADYPTIPHGGWKKSGFGRFNGLVGIREFCQVRCRFTGTTRPFAYLQSGPGAARRRLATPAGAVTPVVSRSVLPADFARSPQLKTITIDEKATYPAPSA